MTEGFGRFTQHRILDAARMFIGPVQSDSGAPPDLAEAEWREIGTCFALQADWRTDPDRSAVIEPIRDYINSSLMRCQPTPREVHVNPATRDRIIAWINAENGQGALASLRRPITDEILGVRLVANEAVPENTLFWPPDPRVLLDDARNLFDRMARAQREVTISFEMASGPLQDFMETLRLYYGGELPEEHPMPEGERPVYVESDLDRGFGYDGALDRDRYRGHTESNGGTWSELMAAIDTLIDDEED